MASRLVTSSSVLFGRRVIQGGWFSVSSYELVTCSFCSIVPRGKSLNHSLKSPFMHQWHVADSAATVMIFFGKWWSRIGFYGTLRYLFLDKPILYIHTYISISISISLSLYLSIDRSIVLSFYPSIHLSIHPSIHSSIDLSIYRSNCNMGHGQNIVHQYGSCTHIQGWSWIHVHRDDHRTMNHLTWDEVPKCQWLQGPTDSARYAIHHIYRNVHEWWLPSGYD